jgi:hypothetical protein
MREIFKKGEKTTINRLPRIFILTIEVVLSVVPPIQALPAAIEIGAAAASVKNVDLRE